MPNGSLSLRLPQTHYVYLYRRTDGTPLYVGKGWGKRAWQHVWVSRIDPESHANRHLSHSLAKMIAEGHDPEPEIVAEFDTHEAALQEEIRLIAKLGRRDIGTGCLTNLTDGGEGAVGRGVSVEVDGREFPTYREACNHYGLKEGAVRNRINVYGWTIRQAFDLDPPPERPPSFTKEVSVRGRTFESIEAACHHFGLDSGTVYKRFKYGWLPNVFSRVRSP